jgi:small subunit ribosomal protein S20
MANHKSAIKRIKKSNSENSINRIYLSKMKSAIKSVKTAKNKEEAEKFFRNTSSLFDKLVSKKVIHKNKAANEKSKLAKLVNSMS